MSEELGTLVVVVLEARNLHDRHSFYKQNPYARVTLNGKTFKTDAVVKGGQHPKWDVEFRFPVYAVKNDFSRRLEVACWRAESKEDEEIGKGNVNISDTLRTGEFDDWVTISDAKGSYKGELYLEMTFFSSEPPPLEQRPSMLPLQGGIQRPRVPSEIPIPGGYPAVTGFRVHGASSPKKDKPLPLVQESRGPAPLRPDAGAGKANEPGRRLDGYISPINSRPPSPRLPSRPSTPPVHQPNNTTCPFKIPDRRSSTPSGSGYKLSYPSHAGHSPLRLSRSTPSMHPPPQSAYPPLQPEYPQPRLTCPPTSQLGYTVQAPPQFPSRRSTYPIQHQSTYLTHGRISPAPGLEKRPFFGREGKIGGFLDRALMRRCLSPLLLFKGTRPSRSSSLVVRAPSASPPHPDAGTYNPNTEYGKELQRRREQESDAELARQLQLEGRWEQEEMDAKLARQLDLELNIGSEFTHP